MRSVYATGEVCPVADTSFFVGMPRELIEMIIAAAIEELDSRDGDPDLEDDEPETYAVRFRLAMPWPGTPEDEEENHDLEHDPAEWEDWFQPNWHPSAALSRATNLFQRSAHRSKRKGIASQTRKNGSLDTI